MKSRTILFLVLSSLIASNTSKPQDSETPSQNLTVREIVLSSSSSFVFEWTRCVRCDGYDALLFVSDSFVAREIPYHLDSDVTSLKITDVPPRASYYFILKKIPPDNSTSKAIGSSSTRDVPPAVESLVVKALPNSSLEVEWKYRSGDGILLRVLRKSMVVRERILRNNLGDSAIKIVDLEPSTVYDIQVMAFYGSPENASSAKSVQIKTLPLELPVPTLTWNIDKNLELSWKNPEWPIPTSHKLSCSDESVEKLSILLRGNTDSVAFPPDGPLNAEDLICTLYTWYGENEQSGVSSQALIPKRHKNPLSMSREWMDCYYNTVHFRPEAGFKEAEDTKSLIVTFSLGHNSKNEEIHAQLQYKLCVRNGSCEEGWRNLQPGDNAQLVLEKDALRAWTSHIIYYRFAARCYNLNKMTTSVRSLELPAQPGKVEPPTSITLEKFRVSWNYENSSSTPDYFLVISCVRGKCKSRSVEGKQRGIAYKSNEPSYILVRAVKIHAGKAFVSLPATTTWNSQKDSSPWVSVAVEELTDSPSVRVHMTDISPPDALDILEHHVSVCHEPLLLSNSTVDSVSPVSKTSCESITTSESSITVVREPWSAYNVSIVTCFGTSGSLTIDNLLLPVFRKNPGSVSNLSWDKKHQLLTWEYGSVNLSGFSISICRLIYPREQCNSFQAKPLAREFRVSPRMLQARLSVPWKLNFKALISPFVNFDDKVYKGTESRISLL